MLTGEVRSRIDRIWNDFWSGGIANPLEVMEQITYLLFLKRLDELQTLAENEQRHTGRSTRTRPFPTGADAAQIQFVTMIIDDLTQHGVIDPGRFYQSPFVDVAPVGPSALFTEADVHRLIETAAAVRTTAEVA